MLDIEQKLKSKEKKLKKKKKIIYKLESEQKLLYDDFTAKISQLQQKLKDSERMNQELEESISIVLNNKLQNQKEVYENESNQKLRKEIEAINEELE